MLDLSLTNIITIIQNLIFAVGVIEIIRFGWRKLYHPNISVTDVELVKYYPMPNDTVCVDLKWRVHNNPRFVWFGDTWFGDYLILMKTMFFVGRGDQGEWHWSGTVSGPQNLPVTEKTLQTKNWINKEFPQDTYRIYFVVFSEDKVVFKRSFKVPLKETKK